MTGNLGLDCVALLIAVGVVMGGLMINHGVCLLINLPELDPWEGIFW